MATVAIRVDMPPKGELETSQDASEPTEDQMNEELAIRQEFLDYVGPRLAELPKRPPHAVANVSRVELDGGNVWSQLNHYLVVLTVDVGIPDDLDELFLADADLTVLGPYEALETWSEILEGQAA